MSIDDPFDLGHLEAPPAPAELAEPPYLGALNNEQRQAVEALDGPLLVLAGAGTGKTRVLTTRLAHILFARRAWPSQVLAVTFTNKAAREMKHRVEQLFGGEVEGLWLGTFHAIGVRILRRHAELVGLKSNFTILDTDDQIRLLKQLLEAAEIDTKKWPPRVLAGLIDRWKNAGYTPEKLPESESGGFADGKGPALYKAYQARLATLNAADFGDLLLHCLTLFTGHADVLEQYQQRFRYILVDEYQDTNTAQYLWLRLLAQGHRNICCVGDDDQSIYGWRGAEVGNILRFEKDFPGARIVRLERNYRSTPHILGAASGVIAHNEGRLGKTLWTDLNEGDPVRVRGVWDGAEEARHVVDEVEALQRDSHSLNQMAILVRASFQTREFEERLLQLGIHYRVIGGLRFYERQELRDALAYLRVIAQADDDLAFERIVNVPKRGLGEATIQALHRTARAAGTSLTRAAWGLVETDELRPKARASLRRLLEDFDRWRSLLDVMPPPELAETVLEESGYTDMWQRDKSPDAPGRLENLKELIHALEDYETMAGFLEHVSLVATNEEAEDQDMINLMTLHAAKGLEFDTVFLPGWEEGLFPHQRALDEGGLSALEEERRLAYVGLTRARRNAYVSFAANRRVYNQWQSSVPSRFVEELPADHVEKQSDQGLYAGGSHASFAYDAPWLKPAMRREPKRRGLIEATAEVVDGTPDGGYQAGVRIFHQKFGYGRIRNVDGDKLEIDFEKSGSKKVMAAFVEPA